MLLIYRFSIDPTSVISLYADVSECIVPAREVNESDNTMSLVQPQCGY